MQSRVRLAYRGAAQMSRDALAQPGIRCRLFTPTQTIYNELDVYLDL